jgi:hypothetical protein
LAASFTGNPTLIARFALTFEFFGKHLRTPG